MNPFAKLLNRPVTRATLSELDDNQLRLCFDSFWKQSKSQFCAMYEINQGNFSTWLSFRKEGKSDNANSRAIRLWLERFFPLTMTQYLEQLDQVITLVKHKKIVELVWVDGDRTHPAALNRNDFLGYLFSSSWDKPCPEGLTGVMSSEGHTTLAMAVAIGYNRLREKSLLTGVTLTIITGQPALFLRDLSFVPGLQVEDSGEVAAEQTSSKPTQAHYASSPVLMQLAQFLRRSNRLSITQAEMLFPLSQYETKILKARSLPTLLRKAIVQETIQARLIRIEKELYLEGIGRSDADDIRLAWFTHWKESIDKFCQQHQLDQDRFESWIKGQGSADEDCLKVVTRWLLSLSE